MLGIFGPRFEKSAPVERTDNGDRGTLLDDALYDYVAVRWWRDNTTSWTRRSLLRLLPVVLT